MDVDSRNEVRGMERAINGYETGMESWNRVWNGTVTELKIFTNRSALGKLSEMNLFASLVSTVR